MFANILLALALGACIYGFFAWPADVVPTFASGKGQADQPAAETPNAPGPLATYSVIHARDLRKPLYDPKPTPPPKATPKPRPSLPVKLMGIVAEPGFSYAMVKGKSGETRIVSVGQSLDGAELTAVSETAATFKFAGETFELKFRGGDKP